MPAVVSPNAMTIIEKRYFDKSSGEKTVEEMWKRVSGGNRDYEELVSELLFLPNSPTLFNLGTKHGGTLSACFTIDTVIHCLAGDFTVAELLARGEPEFEVFSTDGRRLKIGRAFGLRKTREAAEVYKVRFDTGDSIKLTADHLVMVRDGTYRSVSALAVGDSVMPFNHDRKGGYRIVWQTIDGNPIAAYKWAFLHGNGRWAARGMHIHHRNFNKADDRPANLQELTESEHYRLHWLGANNPMHDPAVAAKISRLMVGNKRGVGPKPGVAAAMMGNRHAAGTVWTEERREKHRQRMMGNTRRRDAKLREATRNHKVVSVEYVGREDVYDLSVHDYHNFAANGVFIHNCFVFDFEDSLRDGTGSIMGTLDKAAAVAKAGGGVGYYLGNIRPKGSLVRSTHKHACGPVEVMRMCNRLARLITQGGKRDLAQMGVMNADHPDIRDFIHCKDEDPQAIGAFNISVSWRDEMLRKVDFKSKQGTPETVLWWEQAESAWRSGDPGMLFFDAINEANATPHIGTINATNPCGETPNLSNEPCNLGSLALRRFVTDGKVDWQKLERCTRLATRYLDDILDWNTFPHPDIDRMSRSTRKLGLGVMGWADMLALLRIPYDTQDAVDLAESLWGRCARWALEESVALARTKGVYPAYSPEQSPAWAPAARNSTRTSIAPTGTISIIADCSSGIEPHFALEWERTTYEGIKMQERIPVWDQLGGFKPKIANEIGIEWHIRHQAAFQKHTDLGVSKTINLPNTATVDDVSAAYRMMWETRCKGGTIFRDGCRDEQVLVDTSKRKTASVYNTGHATTPARRKLPAKRGGTTSKFHIGGVKGYYTVNTYPDGTPGEIFVVVGNQGSTLDGFLDAWAKTFSTALQYGTPLKDLIRLHKNARFEPSGFTGDPAVPSCTSIPDYIVRDLERVFLKSVGEKASSGVYCPDCGSGLVREEGCLKCHLPGCGYSRC